MNNTIYEKYKKNYKTYLLLLLFAGFFGLHDLYLQRTKAAKTKIYLTLGSFFSLILGPLSFIPSVVLSFLILKDLLHSSKDIKQYNNSLNSILNNTPVPSDTIASELYTFLEKNTEEYLEHCGILGLFFGYNMYLRKTKKCFLKNLPFLIPYWVFSLCFYALILTFIFISLDGFNLASYWLLLFLPLTPLIPFAPFISIYPIVIIITIIISIICSKREKEYASAIVENFNADLLIEIMDLLNQPTNQ